MVPHAGVVNRLFWQARQYALDERDVFVQKTPFSFDVSVWELFLPLILGAKLVIARPDGHKDPAYLYTLLTEQAVSIVHFVPSMLSAFLSQVDTIDLPSLKRIICSGEALPAELAAAFHRKSGAHLENLYGPTEASVDVTAHACVDADKASIPIGRPIDNIRTYILDNRLQAVPIGVSGELYLGGVGLADGYLARPGLTAERFIPSPFAATPGERLYRTGDVAHWNAAGEIEYQGRTDHQIKLRGIRIEAGEIEAALRTHPAINDAVVVLRTRSDADQQLIAYFAAPDDPPSMENLREHLRQSLPNHMIPSHFVPLDHLPLSSNGKVDRKALPDSTPMVSQMDYVAPGTQTEKQLVEIWKALLEQERIGVNDNFFHLGGHSLMAVQLSSRIRDTFTLEIPLIELFAHPSVAELARLIDAKTATAVEVAPKIKRLDRSKRRGRISRNGVTRESAQSQTESGKD
jgi:acyl-coenzyme A synthetase/AMP-(fatty) acid ligase/acyl carrier protein